MLESRLANPVRLPPMKNPFDSLLGTVILGAALTAVLYHLVRSLVVI